MFTTQPFTCQPVAGIWCGGTGVVVGGTGTVVGGTVGGGGTTTVVVDVVVAGTVAGTVVLVLGTVVVVAWTVVLVVVSGTVVVVSGIETSTSVVVVAGSVVLGTVVLVVVLWCGKHVGVGWLSSSHSLPLACTEPLAHRSTATASSITHSARHRTQRRASRSRDEGRGRRLLVMHRTVRV